jgi:hypothetical protein
VISLPTVRKVHWGKDDGDIDSNYKGTNHDPVESSKPSQAPSGR